MSDPAQLAAEIKGALDEVESANDDVRAAAREQRRATRRLHNLLASALADHGAALGIGDDEVVALGGGTNKPPEED